MYVLLYAYVQHKAILNRIMPTLSQAFHASETHFVRLVQDLMETPHCYLFTADCNALSSFLHHQEGRKITSDTGLNAWR